MAREPVSFRMRRTLLQAIRKECNYYGLSLTEWIEHACMTRLGNEVGAIEDSKPEVERIAELEKQVTSLWSAINYAASKIEENQDNIDRIDDLEARMGEVLEGLAILSKGEVNIDD